MIPAKTHYACLAMVELALKSDKDRPVALREITERHEIPQPFLVQILQQLKISGLVTSARGPQGGYRLNRRPDEVTLLDIVEAMGGDTGASFPGTDGSRVGFQVDQVWQAAASAQRDVLARTRLGDLVRACETRADTMFYI
jgi:Rrf2 family protein